MLAGGEKLALDPAMSLSETDRREVCALHGWVGRSAFQLDRHDLCVAPLDDLPSDDPAVEAADEEAEETEDSGLPVVTDINASGNRTSARRRGIPPKKTLAVRRITQLELEAGRAELRALGGDDPYARPKTRGDCQLCPVCQLVRDGKSDGLDSTARRALAPLPRVLTERRVPHEENAEGRLACGHRLVEVIQHSRPCVFAACKHSLYLDVSETGSIILNFPHLDPGQMPADRSCALDLAERGSMTLEEIAAVTNLTRERIRQVELRALNRRARPAAVALGLGPEDAAALGTRHHVGPGADLEETGVEGAVPSDVATILTSNGRD